MRRRADEGGHPVVVGVRSRDRTPLSPARGIRFRAGFVTPASARWTLVGALAKGHEEDQLRGISVPT
jgi:hypothetical protein